MTRSETIKFRVTPRLKAALTMVAGESDVSLSYLLRGVAGQVVEGHNLDATVRADMLMVRLLANGILAWVDEAALDQDGTRPLVDAGERLRAVAARHLKPLS